MSEPQQPTARLLLRVLHAFERDLQAHLHANGFQDVTVAQTNVLRHLDSDGMRQTDLARDANITKQAASQAIRALMARDLVVVEPDAEDARARRVLYTDRGRALIASALGAIVELEAAWKEQLGEADYHRLRELLTGMG